MFSSHVHWPFGAARYRRYLRRSWCFSLRCVFVGVNVGSGTRSPFDVPDGPRGSRSQVLLYESSAKHVVAFQHNVVYDAHIFGGRYAVHNRDVRYTFYVWFLLYGKFCLSQKLNRYRSSQSTTSCRFSLFEVCAGYG